MQTDPNNAATETLVDGGTPTDEEARLSAQIDTIGDDPQEEPAATPAAKPAAEPAATDPPAASEPAQTEATPPAAEPEPTPPPTPRPQPVQAEAPQPPRDFDAAAADVQRRFDSGEIDGDEFQKELRAIAREESAFAARLEIFNERQQSAAQQAESEFAAAALAWEQANAAFMGNPLRAKAMQDAILAVEAENPSLAPADLLAKAQTIAFEAYGYTPTVDTSAADEAARKAQALAAAKAQRQPGRVPPTLGTAPTAAQVDAPTSGSAFANLDALDIDSLENQVARMKPDQLEAYLADAPGAKSTGHE